MHVDTNMHRHSDTEGRAPSKAGLVSDHKNKDKIEQRPDRSVRKPAPGGARPSVSECPSIFGSICTGWFVLLSLLMNLARAWLVLDEHMVECLPAWLV